jgi:PKD repeat protein
MKKAFTTGLLLFCVSWVFGQLHDNTWVIGYQGGTSAKFGFSILTFSDGRLKIDSTRILGLDSDDNNSSFSSLSGDLVAFFYGFDILDRSYGILKNGGGLNVDIEKFIYSLSDDDLPQGSIFLPYSGHPDSCILFYMSQREYTKPNGQIYLVSSDLSFVVINTQANNGLGQVVNNSVSFIHDTLQYGQLSAVKHANGRDWWVLVKERDTNRFYTLLISPEGVKWTGKQSAGDPIQSGFGNSVFSPDGKKFIVYAATELYTSDGSYISTFDFDRCTGLLSNRSVYTMPGKIGYISLSPSGHFLYQTHYDTVYQYDMRVTDFWKTKTVIGVYDGFLDPFPVLFYQLQLAPDGKIYGSAGNSTRYLHVINNPDEQGANCGFVNHGLRLYKNNAQSVPNHPNYRLGPLDGSPCDTLGLNNWPKAWYRYEPDSLDLLAVDFHDLSYYEPTQWKWDFGDPASGAANQSSVRHPQHFFSKKGVYEVCLTVSNANGSHTHCKTLYLGVSAQDDPVLQSQVLVAPNPFRERLAVSLSASLRSPIFRLYDAMGRLVREERLAYGVTEVETADLPAGLYFWSVEAGGETIKQGKCVKVQEP